MYEPITSTTPLIDSSAAFLTLAFIRYTPLNGKNTYLLKSQDDINMFSVSSEKADREDSDDSQRLAYFGK